HLSNDTLTQLSELNFGVPLDAATQDTLFGGIAQNNDEIEELRARTGLSRAELVEFARLNNEEAMWQLTDQEEERLKTFNANVASLNEDERNEYTGLAFESDTGLKSPEFQRLFTQIRVKADGRVKHLIAEANERSDKVRYEKAVVDA